MVRKLYNKKIIISGKRLEVFNYSDLLAIGEKSKNKEGRKGKDELTKEQKENNQQRGRKDTLYKAKNNIIRLIASNQDLETFVTLTYKENMQDIQLSKKHLNLFFKKLQRDFKDIKYIYVLEFQKRGAIHYHVLLNLNVFDDNFNISTAKSNQKKSDQQKTLENNFRNRYWQKGFVDIRNLREEGNTNIAKYISCYLTQDLLDIDLKSNKIYGFSRNLDKPIVQKISSDETIEELLSLKNYELKYVSSYEMYHKNQNEISVVGNVTYFDYLKK